MIMKVMRQERGWSQSELARRAGLNQSTLNQIESRRLLPYPSQIQKLAQALDWKGDPQELLQEAQITPRKDMNDGRV